MLFRLLHVEKGLVYLRGGKICQLYEEMCIMHCRGKRCLQMMGLALVSERQLAMHGSVENHPRYEGLTGWASTST